MCELPLAVQFESLETACVEFLSGQAQHMDASGLLNLAQFADHLGLTSLLNTAAERLTEMPWHENLVLVSPAFEVVSIILCNRHRQAQ